MLLDVDASGLSTLQLLLLAFYLTVVWQSRGILGSSSSESTLQVREGLTARLQCTAACQPDCHYRWVCSDCNIHSRRGGSILMLPNVTRDHAGLYRCNAYNNDTHAYSSVRLDVLYPARIIELKFEKDASDEKLSFVTCRASGNPSPKEITWDVSNQSTQPKKTYKLRLGQELTSSFPVMSTKCFKNDDFTCITTNGLDPPHRLTASFFVKCASAVDATSCEPSEALQTVKFLDTIVLKLCALAYPRPSVGWRHSRHNVTSISISGYSVSYDTSIARLKTEMRVHIQTPDMYGSYQVLVENEMGVLSRTFVLEAKESPWPPEVLAARDVTSTSACLWWTVGFDGGAPQTFVLRRKVDVNDVDDEKSEMVVVPDNKEQRVERCVLGLKPGTNYTFLLIATNRYGVCPSTVVLSISTPSQRRLSQLLDSDVKEPEDNNLPVDSITPWVVKVVPVGVCLILLVAGGVVIAKRRRRGEKGTPTESLQSTVESATISSNLLENDSPGENMYLTIQETQSVYENEDEGEITVTAHALPSGTQPRLGYGEDGPISAYETLLSRGENGNGPIRAYDALLPSVQSAADDSQVLPPQYIDMTRPTDIVTPTPANDSDNDYVDAMPKE